MVKVNLAEEKLLALSITDELTQAYNRRHFMAMAQHEHAKAKRYHTFFSIALLDIDDFKKINDTYEHLLGDRVLAHLATICAKNIRQPDIVARYGGDEFVFLFSSTRKEQARPSLERMVAEIASTPIQHGPITLPVQVSIGIADNANPTLLVDDILRAPDTALYVAKHAGKNTIALAADTSH